jgi:hypothetical protein
VDLSRQIKGQYYVCMQIGRQVSNKVGYGQIDYMRDSKTKSRKRFSGAKVGKWRYEVRPVTICDTFSSQNAAMGNS